MRCTCKITEFLFFCPHVSKFSAMSPLSCILSSEVEYAWTLSRKDEKLYSMLHYLPHSEGQFLRNCIVLSKQQSISQCKGYLLQFAMENFPGRMWGKELTRTDWEIYLGLSINTEPNKRVTKTTNPLPKKCQKWPKVNLLFFTKRTDGNLNKSKRNTPLK